jgi:hypothetical protein
MSLSLVYRVQHEDDLCFRLSLPNLSFRTFPDVTLPVIPIRYARTKNMKACQFQITARPSRLSAGLRDFPTILEYPRPFAPNCTKLHQIAQKHFLFRLLGQP